MKNMLLFFLAESNNNWIIPVIIITALVMLAGGFALGFFVYKNYRNKKIGTTQQQVDSMLEAARLEAKTLKKKKPLLRQEKKLEDLRVKMNVYLERRTPNFKGWRIV